MLTHHHDVENYIVSKLWWETCTNGQHSRWRCHQVRAKLKFEYPDIFNSFFHYHLYSITNSNLFYLFHPQLFWFWATNSTSIKINNVTSCMHPTLCAKKQPAFIERKLNCITFMLSTEIMPKTAIRLTWSSLVPSSKKLPNPIILQYCLGYRKF